MSQLASEGTATAVETSSKSRSGSFGSGPWTWLAIAAVLLLSSAVVRAMQDRQHASESRFLEEVPFPLKTLPTHLGGWHMMEQGGEQSLDPLTMRITGGTDHILRTYIDELTGVSLVVLVLFGPAEPVMPHTPQVCYPACGYTPTEDFSDRTIKTEDGKSVTFRSCVYTKPGGRSLLREEVYHSFRLDGAWGPGLGDGRKFPRRNPSVFKVQVQRRVAPGERRDKEDPIEQFLSFLVPAIEQKLGAKVPGASNETPTPSVGGVGTAAAGR